MNNFKSGGFKKQGGGFKGKSSFGGDRGHGGGNRGGNDRSVTMHAATCSGCKKSCEVPFKPNGEKPVFCSDCFSKNKPEPSFGNHERHGLNSYKDARPQRNDKPARPDNSKRDALKEMRQRLLSVESKLNKILDIINPPSDGKSEVKVDVKIE